MAAAVRARPAIAAAVAAGSRHPDVEMRTM
jgi:hypothetical protein